MSIQIITKKLSNCLNAKSSDITFGDARTQMASDLLKSLTEVIERKADHPQVYYILVHSKVDPAYRQGNVIKERLILLDQPPATKFIGTILIKVDNKNADAEIVWNLPLDIPGPLWIPTEKGKFKGRNGVAGIMESARGVPILNRRLN